MMMIKLCSKPTLLPSFALLRKGARSFRHYQHYRHPINNTLFLSNQQQNQQQKQQQIRTKMGDKEGVTPSALEIPPNETFFAKMARGEFKPKTVYEDDRALVFEDINPQAPTHLLIIPKRLAIGQVHNAEQNDSEELGYLLYIAGKVAKDNNLLDGYRLVINQGLNAQQSVNYLHIHLMSGRKFHWPPG